MSLLHRVTAATAAALLVGIGLAGGCSSNAGDSPDGTGGTGAGSGTGATGNVIGLGDGQADGPKPFDAGDGEGCGTIRKGVELTPVNLIFIVDKSGSMGAPGQSQPGDIDKRWNPMVTAFTSFFNTVTSPALKASFTFFPAPCDLDLDAGGGCVCSANEYNAAKVAANAGSSVVLTQIVEHAKIFTDMLNNNQPSGGTPTIAALQGAYAYAITVQAASPPGGVTYVVLITDGSPGLGYCAPEFNGCADGGAIGVAGCAGNDITTIQALTASYASQGIKTYVFGMGAIENLDMIAIAGGTSLVTINPDAATTTQQFIQHLNEIPQPVFNCNYPIPDSEGKDLNLVNVFYTNSQSDEQHLIYNNPSCGRGDKSGWYMSGNEIVLCTATCDMLKAEPSSALNVQFGCQTIYVNA